MLLKDLIEGVDCKATRGNLETEISDICFSSKHADKGKCFVAIEGDNFDGNNYLDEAIERGVEAIVCRRGAAAEIHEDIAVVEVDNGRRALAIMSRKLFHKPDENLVVIGITGTKGKTTTSYMLRKILEGAGYKTGLIGTVEIFDGDTGRQSENTTPESYIVQKALCRMVRNGCTHCIIEVSSQALKKDRVWGMQFEYGVFTNIYTDHIGKGEHENFQEYLYWKGMLFQHSKRLVVNGDDPWNEYVIHGLDRKVIKYGLDEDNHIVGENIEFHREESTLGTNFTVRCGSGDKKRYRLGIPGRFSVYNALGATAVALDMGIDERTIIKTLEKVKVRGRQEIINTPWGGTIIVDFAHNAQSLMDLLKSLREYEARRLICLFGCGGQRDKGRRVGMGEVSGRFADFTIVTTDNSRNESPKSIISDIIKGLKKYTLNYAIIPSRREAIEMAVRSCGRGEIAVVAGKGHETYQIIGDDVVHFDDREEVLSSIEKVKNERTDN